MITPKRYLTVATGRGHQVLQTAPDRCRNGHAIGPGQVRVSAFSCSCAGISDDGATATHMVWTCEKCGSAVIDPPHSD